MDNGWIVLGDFYVKPVHEGYMQVIQPAIDGVSYELWDMNAGGAFGDVASGGVLVGTAPTPAAAARL